MRRSRADTIIRDLMTEAQRINSDDQMLWQVDSLSVFDSYLSEKRVLGDLDIGFRLKPLPGGLKQGAIDAFDKIYPAPGYIRRAWFEWLCLPETYVRRRLRFGRNINFHNQDEIDQQGYPHRVIFTASA